MILWASGDVGTNAIAGDAEENIIYYWKLGSNFWYILNSDKRGWIIGGYNYLLIINDIINIPNL